MPSIDPYADLADPFARHYRTIRGQVRETLAARQLAAHLPPPPAEVADIGGGAGPQAIRLARAGYRVTLLDPSEEMLRQAREAIAAEGAGVEDRIQLVNGYGEEAEALLGEAAYDAVICHGVIMYVDDPEPIVSGLGRIARPGGIISIITKNAEALAMRAALEGRFADALAAFGADADIGGMGVRNQAHTVGTVERWLDEAGCDPIAWYGIRVFTDHLGDEPPGEVMADLLAAEEEAGRRDPYRRVARLIHVVARRRG